GALDARGIHARGRRGDLLERATARDAPAMLLDERLGIARGVRVAALHQEPVALLRAHERPATAHSLAAQLEAELAVAELLLGIAERLPLAAVPEQHRTAAVLAFGDQPLEAAVADGVILGAHREAALAGLAARALRHGPAP